MPSALVSRSGLVLRVGKAGDQVVRQALDVVGRDRLQLDNPVPEGPEHDGDEDDGLTAEEDQQQPPNRSDEQIPHRTRR